MYRVNSTSTNEYYSRDEITDTVRWADDESAATIITTEDNGYPAIGFTHLNGGTYYLEEVSAPAGYVPLSNVVTVTIDLNNTDKAVATVPNGDNTVAKTLDIETALDENSNVYTFTVTVKNTVGHELPQTGGCGTQTYTVAGISIIALATVLIIVKRRKSA